MEWFAPSLLQQQTNFHLAQRENENLVFVEELTALALGLSFNQHQPIHFLQSKINEFISSWRAVHVGWVDFTAFLLLSASFIWSIGVVCWRSLFLAEPLAGPPAHNPPITQPTNPNFSSWIAQPSARSTSIYSFHSQIEAFSWAAPQQRATNFLHSSH